VLRLAIGRPVLDIVRLCVEADLPLLLIGPHGIGKSEILNAAANELEIQFISRDLSLMEPPDLVGLPRLDSTLTRYCPPSFLPTSGRGLLVFEELNRCPAYMRAPTLQLLTARTLNDYTLPPGWLPVAAINPAGCTYETFDLDPALLSRFVQVEVRADQSEWLSWALANGIHPAVVAYVSADANVFNHPQSNPRAWQYISKLLRAKETCCMGDKPLFVAVAGLIGHKRAASFRRFLRDGVLPLTADDILGSYHNRRMELQGWIANGQLDLAHGSLLALLKYLQSSNNFQSVRCQDVQWRNLESFLSDLPGDLREEARDFFVERKLQPPCIKGGKRG
jgi:hypothetical protein